MIEITQADRNAAEWRHGPTCQWHSFRDSPCTCGAIEAFAREIERLRGLLREAEIKLTDVQGAYATRQYSANLLSRIRVALGETFEDLGQEFEAVWDVNRDKLYEGDTK